MTVMMFVNVVIATSVVVTVVTYVIGFLIQGFMPIIRLLEFAVAMAIVVKQ